MRHKLYVDLTTRGRIWLEARSIPLPDPWAPEDIPVLIEQHYPGGRAGFLIDKAPEATGRYFHQKMEDRKRAKRAAQARERRAKNPEKHRAAAKKYYEENRNLICWNKSCPPSERKSK